MTVCKYVILCVTLHSHESTLLTVSVPTELLYSSEYQSITFFLPTRLIYITRNETFAKKKRKRKEKTEG